MILTYFVILFYMDTWGALVKSQIDSETIEEAISRLIAEHESSPTAHAGDGESLAVHRETSILDHPQASVLADKIADTEFVASTSFDSVDGWSILGDAGIASWPSAYLAVTSGSPTRSQIVTVLDVLSPFINLEKDMLLEAKFRITVDEDIDFLFSLGDYNFTTKAVSGFGYYIDNGNLRGFWGTGASVVYTPIISIDRQVIHTYRAQYLAQEEKMYFYIDGSEVATIEKTTQTNIDNSTLRFNLEYASSTDDVEVILRGVRVSRQY